MSRAGREPAEDVKKRLVTACQEVGLTIRCANMHLIREAGVRVIHVGAATTEWPHEVPMVSVMAHVGQTGQWPCSVDIRCVASERDPVTVIGPWMKGRDRVPFDQLIGQLRETLNERELVLAAVKAGLPGPYRFERSVWGMIDLTGPDSDCA
jgi:hypothetical protein